MWNSPNLLLPYIMPNQAQKHVTHNLAIERLDALVHLSLTELYADAPPEAPFDGQVLGVAVGATGDFEGEGGNLAYRTNGSWMFVAPKNGFKAWVESRGSFYVFQDGQWKVLLSVGIDELEGLGLNTSWDQENRLAVASEATLFTHTGAGHQLKLNKADPEDTASLLFQSDFSGRAEMGLAGSDDFALKVSADGEIWSTALKIAAASGETEFSSVVAGTIGGDAVQASPTDTTPGRLMRADWGYGPGNAVGPVSQSNGLPTGAVVESGENANGTYVRWADGTQICMRAVTISDGQATYDFPAAFSAPPSVSVGGSSGESRSTGGPGYQDRYRMAVVTTVSSGFLGTRWEIRAEPASFGLTDPTSTYDATLLAVGRWF